MKLMFLGEVSESIWLFAKKSANHLEFFCGRGQIFMNPCTVGSGHKLGFASHVFFGGVSSLHYPCKAVDGSLVSELPSVLFFDYSFINIC